MTTCLGKSCSFGLPRVPFVNCCQFMYLVISLLVLRAGYRIWLYQFLIIACLFTPKVVVYTTLDCISAAPFPFTCTTTHRWPKISFVVASPKRVQLYKWASSWDYCTYHIGDQRRLMRACASAQSRQSLHCSHTWSMEVKRRVRPIIRHLVPLDGCACAFEEWVYGGRKVQQSHEMAHKQLKPGPYSGRKILALDL